MHMILGIDEETIKYDKWRHVKDCLGSLVPEI